MSWRKTMGPPAFLEDESRYVASLTSWEFARLFPEAAREERGPTRAEFMERMPLAMLPDWFVAKELWK